MQNIDFYERKNIRNFPPQFMDSYDPEFLPHVAQNTPREMERVRKKASRFFFLISALCIISFTAGIVLGIKFAGAPGRDIVDKKTLNAVADLRKSIPLISADSPAEARPREKLFPKNTYPYVIKIGEEFEKDQSQKIAGYLSRRGHTVILSKINDNYRIYAGPYRSSNDANDALKKISNYKKYSLAEKCRIIKR